LFCCPLHCDLHKDDNIFLDYCWSYLNTITRIVTFYAAKVDFTLDKDKVSVSDTLVGTLKH